MDVGNPKALHPKPLNPKPLNPKALNPNALNPTPFRLEQGFEDCVRQLGVPRPSTYPPPKRPC